MRFHCDRCKTRYAIADERVRGKILKIRCKNCSAVITVREGMGGSDASDPQAVPGAKAASPSAGHQRVERRSGPIASSASHRRPSSQRLATEAASPPAAVLQAARAQSAPDDDEIEWYISLEGESNGPFSAEDAREWIRGRHTGDELFCWHSGFDDWLPVEEVDPFRGLRSRLPSHTALTPQPDFDVGGRADSDGAPRLVNHPVAESIAASAAMGSAARPDPASLFGDPGAGVMANAGAGRREPASPDAGKANGESAWSSRLAANPPASPDDSKASRLSNDAFEAAAGDGDGPDDLDFEIGEPSRIVKLPMLMAQANAGAAAASSGTGPVALPGMAGTPAAIGRGTGSDPIIGRSSGSVAALSSSSDGPGSSLSDEGGDPILRPETRRRSTMPLILAALGVAGVAAAVLAFFVLSKSGDDSNTQGSRRNMPSNLEELGFHHDNPAARTKETDDRDGPEADDTRPIKTGPTRRTRPNRPRNNGDGQTRPENPGNGTSGTGRQVPGQNPADASKPLSPDEVQRMATRSQSGFVRCYERAKRKDPFLEVKSLKLTLTVGRDGSVSKVSLSNHQDSPLGMCLKGAVGRWSFRASKGGITTEIGLKFER